MKLKKISFHTLSLINLFLLNGTVISEKQKKTLNDILMEQYTYKKLTLKNQKPFLFKAIPNMTLYIARTIYNELYPKRDYAGSTINNPLLIKTTIKYNQFASYTYSHEDRNTHFDNAIAATATDAVATNIIVPYLRDLNYISKKTEKDLYNTIRSNTTYQYYNLLYQTPEYNEERAKNNENVAGIINKIKKNDFLQLRNTIWYTTHNFGIRKLAQAMGETELGKKIMNCQATQDARTFINNSIPGGTETVRESALMLATLSLQLIEQQLYRYIADDKKK